LCANVESRRAPSSPLSELRTGKANKANVSSIVASRKGNARAVCVGIVALDSMCNGMNGANMIRPICRLQILQKEGERNISMLENEIVKRREESTADVEAYKKEKAAQANRVLYTEQYVQLEMAKALSNNTKFYFSGQDSALGSLLSNVLGRG